MMQNMTNRMGHYYNRQFNTSFQFRWRSLMKLLETFMTNTGFQWWRQTSTGHMSSSFVVFNWKYSCYKTRSAPLSMFIVFFFVPKFLNTCDYLTFICLYLQILIEDLDRQRCSLYKLAKSNDYLKRSAINPIETYDFKLGIVQIEIQQNIVSILLAEDFVFSLKKNRLETVWDLMKPKLDCETSLTNEIDSNRKLLFHLWFKYTYS